MKLPETHNEDAWVDDRIERFLDGDLNSEEQEVMKHLLDTNAVYQDRVLAAKRLQQILGALPSLECPPHIARQVSRWALLNMLQEGIMRGYRAVMVPVWKPALATVVLVCSIWFVSQITPVEPVAIADQSQAEEVDQALNEIKFALGYVSQVGREAGASVQLAIDPLRSEPESIED